MSKSPRIKVIEKPLDNLVFVTVKISMITGRFQLKKEMDLGLEKDSLPPSELASLGSMNHVDPELIMEGERIRDSIDIFLKKNGLVLPLGYAIKKEKLKETIDFIDDKKALFLQWKQKMVNTFDDAKKDWQDKFPNYKHLIAKKKTDKSYLLRQIDFDVKMFKVQADSVPDAGSYSSDFVSGLARSLFEEVAYEIDHFISARLKANSLSGRSLKVLSDKVIGKLDEYQFVAPDAKSLKTHLLNTLIIIQDQLSLTKKLQDDPLDKAMTALKRFNSLQKCSDIALEKAKVVDIRHNFKADLHSATFAI